MGGALGALSSVAKQPLTSAGLATIEVLEGNASKLNSFTGGAYKLVTANDDMVVYRVSGGTSSKEFGDYFSTIKPTSSAYAEEMLNINTWGNPGKEVIPVIIKQGSQFAIGPVEGGNGTQIFIPYPFQNSGGNKVIRLLNNTTTLK